MKKFIILILFLIPALFFAQNTYVPDDNFEKALIDLGYDTLPLNDSVPTAHIDSVTYLGMNYKNIIELTGLEDFRDLEYLDCNFNQLTNLDLSKNTALKYVYCSYNELMNLNLNGCTDLEILSCLDNKLKSLDISKMTALKSLSCSFNNLTNLDLSNCSALNELYCHENELTSLDVSDNPLLESLSCYSNKLSNLDLRACSSLNYLYCSNNELKSLDMNNFSDIVNISCYNNKLNSLNVGNCSSLYELSCATNELTNLDVISCPSLITLQCHNNMIKILDLSKNLKLQTLSCYFAGLTNLDIRNGYNQSIIYFEARNNSGLDCIQVDDSTNSGEKINWFKDDKARYSENCNYTGIREEKFVNIENSISPNPASDFIEINVGAGSKPALQEIGIYDVFGRCVVKNNPLTPFGKGELKIDVSGLAPGMYFVRIGDRLEKFVKI